MVSFSYSYLRNNTPLKYYSGRLLLASLLLTLSSGNYAFDNQAFGQTQAMVPFLRRFGELGPNGKYALPADFLSYSNAFPFTVQFCGIIFGSFISERYGRRMTIFVMSIWALCCVPVILTSQGRSQFLAARCLNSLYIGMEMSTIPVFQGELVPGPVRGLAVASYQMSFSVGGFIISGICNRTSRINNDWAWRIPFLCFIVVPSVVASLIWFQPESPRWLLSKGQTEEARVSLRRLRRGNDEEVEVELQTIIEALEKERAAQRGANATYWDIFKGTNAKRTMISVLTGFFQQATGQVFSSLYGPVIVSQLGAMPTFTFTLVNTALGFVAQLFTLLFNDKIGRRTIMLVGVTIQGISMFIIAATGSLSSQTAAIKSTTLTFIIIYGIGFSGGWAPLSYVVMGEVPQQTLRQMTTRTAFGVTQITQFATAFSLPYLLYAPYANLGMKVGFIFAPFCVLALVWGYLFIPECKGLNLEQIDEMFEQGITARKSAKWSAQKRLEQANTSSGYDETLEAGSIPMGTKSADEDINMDTKESGVLHLENRDAK